MPDRVSLTCRRDISLEAYRKIAFENAGLAIGGDAVWRMNETRAAFLKLLDDPSVVIYGVTSGFGQYAVHRYSPEERALHARRAPLVQAAAFGAALPERIVRGIVLARLANFLDGHAAVRPELAVGVAGMLDARLPAVPFEGQGAAGEIMALSALFGGVGERVGLAEKEALALINGAPCAAALAADAHFLARGRLEAALRTLAAAIVAFDVPRQHYSRDLGELWGQAAEKDVLAALCPLIGSSWSASAVQAPVSFRVIPRLLGRALRACREAGESGSAALRAVTDNPVYLPPDEANPLGRICSTGGFHDPRPCAALDELAASYADMALLGERLCSRLIDPAFNGLEDDGPGNDRDLTCVAMTALAQAERARHAAQRTLLPGSESGGFGRSDIATPTFDAWSRHETAAAAMLSVFACLLLVSLCVLQRRRTVELPGDLRRWAGIFAPSIPAEGEILLPGSICGSLLAKLENEVLLSASKAEPAGWLQSQLGEDQ